MGAAVVTGVVTGVSTTGAAVVVVGTTTTSLLVVAGAAAGVADLLGSLGSFSVKTNPSTIVTIHIGGADKVFAWYISHVELCNDFRESRFF
jgi:hypothetical protein